MKTFILRGLFLGGVMLSQVGMAQPGMIKLTKPSDIKDADQVEQAVNRISTKVMECVKQKLAQPQDCHCLYPKEMNNMRQVFAKVTSIHPDWKDKVVNYHSPSSQFDPSLSFYTLSMQLKQKCK
jgi:hypothetical protein